MLQMIYSDWIVRFFLLYLVLVGGLTLMRRQRPRLSPPFDFLVLTSLNETSTDRGRWCAELRERWLSAYGTKDAYRPPSESKIRTKIDRDDLRYA
jgi:hypothetical protein